MEKIRFEEMDLSSNMQKAIKGMGFEEATAVQTVSIPKILDGRDIIGYSQTGTGKTAAFGIPAIEMVDPEDKSLQVLILCPTRELAVQGCEELRKFAKYSHGIKILPIYGGQGIDSQIKMLKQGVQIVIGTPGRVMDHMRRRTLKTQKVKMMILDEADEMLNMGFREDIDIILNDIPKDRQTILFSATMSKEILAITEKYQKSPELVKITHTELTVPSIEQYYFEVKQGKKLDLLCNLIDIYSIKLALVFCNTKKMVEELVGELQLRGYLAEGIQGDMKQVSRTRVMDKFRKGNLDILVATDVAARGINVEDIEAVFNYDLPEDEEYYVHRIGRTARAGKSGSSYTFVNGRKELSQLKVIERYAHTKIAMKQAPTVSDAQEIKTNMFIDEIKKVLEKNDFGNYLNIVDKLTEDEFTSADVAAALISMVLSKDAKQSKPEAASDAEIFSNSKLEIDMAKLFINIGKQQDISAKDVIGAIANSTGISGRLIGKIEIFDKFSFVEVPSENADEILSVMNHSKIKGKNIKMELANSKNKR